MLRLSFSIPGFLPGYTRLFVPKMQDDVIADSKKYCFQVMMNPVMSKKKVVFAAIKAGGGHMRPAEVICEALADLYPEKYDLTVLDFMKDLGCTALDDHHKRSWRFLLGYPRLTKLLQLFSSVSGPLTRGLLLLYVTPFFACLKRYLETEKPDLIVSTHFLNTLAVSHVRRRWGLEVGLINFLTEIFDCNAYWFIKNVDHYLVSTQQVEAEMAGRGYPAEKLQRVAYPVKVTTPPSPEEKAALRIHLGLEPARQTMLVSFGSEGIGPLENLLTYLRGLNLPLNIIVICGHNHHLRQRLAKRFTAAEAATRIIPLGFIDYIRELICSVDFCYIKPGPATTWEVMSCRKPILFTRSAQISEEKVLRYACSLGIARYGGVRPRDIARQIEQMMQPSFQDACRSRYEGLSLPAGGEDIARFIDRFLSGS
jgi:UDP-N-acetylglucosamine:LPS N-acetylglucosamine transferase